MSSVTSPANIRNYIHYAPILPSETTVPGRIILHHLNPNLIINNKGEDNLHFRKPNDPSVLKAIQQQAKLHKSQLEAFKQQLKKPSDQIGEFVENERTTTKGEMIAAYNNLYDYRLFHGAHVYSVTTFRDNVSVLMTTAPDRLEELNGHQAVHFGFRIEEDQLVLKSAKLTFFQPTKPMNPYDAKPVHHALKRLSIDSTVVLKNSQNAQQFFREFLKSILILKGFPIEGARVLHETDYQTLRSDHANKLGELYFRPTIQGANLFFNPFRVRDLANSFLDFRLVTPKESEQRGKAGWLMTMEARNTQLLEAMGVSLWDIIQPFKDLFDLSAVLMNTPNPRILRSRILP